MPLIIDAAAEFAPPMLTCLHVNDGYQFELLIRVPRDGEPVTKVQIGPYHFRKEYQPKPVLGGLISVGGPESSFWMHKSTPPRWTRVKWEVTIDEEGKEATYLSWSGNLEAGQTGIFRFISLFPPGGLRQGLVLQQGKGAVHYGVNGPNFEKFEANEHH